MEIGETSTKKIKRSEDEQVDRLSNLPDSILIHILSLLPIKDAVSTMLLRRFGRLWTSLQTLEFDGRSYEGYKDVFYQKQFFKFVHHVLFLHDCSSVFKFSLKFGSYLYFSPNDANPNRPKKPLNILLADEVNSWIDFAVSKNVKVLDLRILAHGSSSTRFDYELPDTDLTWDSLTELNLVNIGLSEELQVQMRSLKTLSLTTIVLSDVIIENILVGCPLLENLSIIQCCGMRKLNCTSKTLKHLMLVLGEYEVEPVEIWGPHLNSLHIAGTNGNVVLKNLLSLVEATLDLSFGGGCPTDRYIYVGVLLEKLHHANTFTISDWCILALSLWEVAGACCPYSPRRFMTLRTPLTKCHLLGIASLLKSSPNLETLTIHIEAEAESSLINTGDDLRIGISGPRQENFWYSKAWLSKCDFDEEQYYSKPHVDGVLNHLKTVKISGSVSNVHLCPLVRFLLVNARVLENMVIYTGKSRDRDHHIQKFSKKISGSPRASDSVVIMFR